MFRLLVQYPGEIGPRVALPITKAADVLTRIPELLAEHDGCEHVIVYFNDVRLFGIDCAGNRVD